jgi:hypothetical protein
MCSARIAVVLTTTLCATSFAATAQVQTDEVTLRAAYLSRFAQFVDWPPDKQSGPVSLCISGGGRILDEVATFAAAETGAPRPLTLRAITPNDAIESCHVLYVPASERRPERVLKAAATHHVLSVGEGPDFLDAGGAVALRIVDRRLRFDIDLGNVQRAGLRVSSRLLRLAAAIRGSGQ